MTGPDELVRTLSADGGVSVRAIVGTGLVAEAARRHALGPTGASALGRALMGGALLASAAHDGETLQLQFRGNGPLRGVFVIATWNGEVRGYVSNPAGVPALRDGEVDVGGGIGTGLLAVVRSHPAWRSPHRGVVPLVSGEVAEDLTHYLAKSEQTPSAVALGVRVGPSGVESAGGFLVQALPDADPDTVARVEFNLRAIISPADMVEDGARGDDFLDILLQGVGMRERARHRVEPRFACPCGRERVAQTVTLLGRSELRQIVARGERVDVDCEFCGAHYALTPDEVGALLPDS